jgi:Holliday junction DNA helicase RuvA
MIGYLQGKVIYSDGAKAMVLTNSGVGYELNYGYFLESESTTGMYVYHSITENNQSLWGFRSLDDKKVFELLLTVNKVGPSKAYPLITTLGPQKLLDSIIFEQTAVLTQAPGIGKKMAEQIVLSLKDKAQKLIMAKSNAMANGDSQMEIEQVLPTEEEYTSTSNPQLVQEAILALESLGYKDKDFMPVINKSLNPDMTTSEDLIKKVLKEL